MSVVIKGMIKPKDCGYCQFCIEEDVMFETEFRCSITGIYMDEDHCFPDICPIVELPEHHGDLVDVKEIRWDDHYDSDGNLSKYKIAYSDEMPDPVIKVEELSNECPN